MTKKTIDENQWYVREGTSLYVLKTHDGSVSIVMLAVRIFEFTKSRYGHLRKSPFL